MLSSVKPVPHPILSFLQRRTVHNRTAGHRRIPGRDAGLDGFGYAASSSASARMVAEMASSWLGRVGWGASDQ